MFGGWPAYRREPLWQTSAGIVHPFKDYQRVHSTEAEALTWSDGLDREGEQLFCTADVIVVTLGLIEAWRHPATGNYFRQIPHPDVFPQLKPEFVRLTTADMLDDLQVIRDVIRAHTSAALVLTVSPVPLHATVTPLDVRVANVESKHRIRAAVSEFVEAYPDVHYFHSYEIVTTAERLSDFMLADGRHVSRPGVDYIVQQFVSTFGAEGLTVPETDLTWLTPPAKTAARLPPARPGWRSWLGQALRRESRRL